MQFALTIEKDREGGRSGPFSILVESSAFSIVKSALCSFGVSAKGGPMTVTFRFDDWTDFRDLLVGSAPDDGTVRLTFRFTGEEQPLLSLVAGFRVGRTAVEFVEDIGPDAPHWSSPRAREIASRFEARRDEIQALGFRVTSGRERALTTPSPDRSDLPA
jgi:hypothetical protein